MGRAEHFWVRIVGVLLILLGIVLLVSPSITYTTREKVIQFGSVDVTAKRQKAIVVPRLVAMLVIAGGVTVLVLVRGQAKP